MKVTLASMRVLLATATATAVCLGVTLATPSASSGVTTDQREGTSAVDRSSQQASTATVAFRRPKSLTIPRGEDCIYPVFQWVVLSDVPDSSVSFAGTTTLTQLPSKLKGQVSNGYFAVNQWQGVSANISNICKPGRYVVKVVGQVQTHEVSPPTIHAYVNASRSFKVIKAKKR